jgi:methionine synthase II (cobalamin-independent)
MSINPPFRAEHAGSFLRPPAVHEARGRWRRGEIDDDELREISDREIAAMVAKQAATRITSITDGEFRRDWFHLDFLQGLGGITVEGQIASTSNSEATVHFAPPRVTVTGKLTHDTPILHEAADQVALDQLCLSPQCGFSSTIHGNVMTEDQQWAKLRHVVEIAGEVWG